MHELTIQEAFPVKAQEYHMGIIQVSASVLDSLGITIMQTDTQGYLCDSGVFAQLHERLLLPASYTIQALFFNPLQRCWHLWVKSPDLPAVREYAYTPYVSPVYTRNHRADDTAYNQLVEMTSGEWKRDYRAENLIAEWKGEWL